MKIPNHKTFRSARFALSILTILLMDLAIAATSIPFHFQGRFVGLLCETLPNGKLDVHDQIIDNGLSVDFNINDISAPTRLSSSHRWGGRSKNGILSNAQLAQTGQISGNILDGSVRFQAVLTLDVNGKLINLPYTISTDAPSLPALPTGIGARKLQIIEQNKAANVALAGVTYLQGDTATVFRNLLLQAGRKVGNGQLLFVTSFDGKISATQ